MLKCELVDERDDFFEVDDRVWCVELTPIVDSWLDRLQSRVSSSKSTISTACGPVFGIAPEFFAVAVFVDWCCELELLSAEVVLPGANDLYTGCCPPLLIDFDCSTSLLVLFAAVLGSCNATHFSQRHE